MRAQPRPYKFDHLPFGARRAAFELRAVVIYQLHKLLVVRAVLRQGRIIDLLHQAFLFGEVVAGVLDQFVKNPAQHGTAFMVAPGVVKPVADVKQLLMLPVDDIDTDTVNRVPRRKPRVALPLRCVLPRVRLRIHAAANINFQWSSFGQAPGDRLQTRGIDQPDALALNREQAILLKTRE